MRLLIKNLLLLSLLLALVRTGNSCWALPQGFTSSDQPIVLIAVDKMESAELFSSKLPNLQKLVRESACGLMNVRSGNGYSTESGYLTIGTGNRGTIPETPGGAFEPDEFFNQEKAGDFWKWSISAQATPENLLVPEIGSIINTAELEDHPVKPGLLGDIFHLGGWETSLIGNQDSINEASRPGGYTIMNGSGVISKGAVNKRINAFDSNFPYFYRLNINEALNTKYIKPRNLILIEFGDFARLDKYSEEILPKRYIQLKKEAWQHLDQLIGGLLNRSGERPRFIIFSPSLSKEGISKKRMLAPILISAPGFPRGMLTSGTTNWVGLVANIDLLPTLTEMAGLKPSGNLSGRPIRSIPVTDHLAKLLQLDTKINLHTLSQRPLLDWYLWAISNGWIAITLSILFRKKWGAGWLVFCVAVLPLSMLFLPILPLNIWPEVALFLFTLIIASVLIYFKEISQSYLILSFALWGGLILDQVTGGNLIRFSPLGYSPVAGSRYYGIGNEFMGVFLAVSLILADLTVKATTRKWPAVLILGLSVFTLGWPELGINFGGTLAALVGFSFYLVNLYHIDWNNRKLWAVFGGVVLIVILVGWWDSLRDPDLQTHLGRFFQLLFHNDLNQTWQIFARKAEMNFKLLVFSPWTRTIFLAFGVIIILRLLKQEKMVFQDDQLVWNSVFLSGLAAFLINDSGVVALGTCLAYGFSFFLNRYLERIFEDSAV